MPPESQNDFQSLDKSSLQPTHKYIKRILPPIIFAFVVLGVIYFLLWKNMVFVDKKPQVLSIEDVKNSIQCSYNVLCPIDYKCVKMDNLPGAKGVCVALDTNQFTDWQTYRNEKYSFEIKYPPNFGVRDLTSENIQHVKNLSLLIGICDSQFATSCNGTTIQVYNGEFREPSISTDTDVKRYKKGNITFWLGGDSNVLSTFKFMEPEMWGEMSPISLTEYGHGQFAVPENLQQEVEMTLKWTGDQSLINYWGNMAYACLIGLDENGQEIEQATELTKNKNVCYPDMQFLLGTTTVSSGKYKWLVSSRSDIFTKLPKSFKLSIRVLDSRPPEGLSEWAGLISESTSNEFKIK